MEPIEILPGRKKILKKSELFIFPVKQKALHFNATPSPNPPHPLLFVSMSLNVSTKSQSVAPQARRRYLVIYIEIYGPKWGEGRQADCLSAYQYLSRLPSPSQAANLLAAQRSF